MPSVKVSNMIILSCLLSLWDTVEDPGKYTSSTSQALPQAKKVASSAQSPNILTNTSLSTLRLPRVIMAEAQEPTTPMETAEVVQESSEPSTESFIPAPPLMSFHVADPSDIDVSEVEEGEPSHEKGLKRGDRSELELISDEPSTSTAQPITQKLKKKPKFFGKKPSDKIPIPPTGHSDEPLLKALREQGGVLDNLADHISTMSNVQLTISEDVRMLKDTITKQSELIKGLVEAVAQLKVVTTSEIMPSIIDEPGPPVPPSKTTLSPAEIELRTNLRSYYQQNFKTFKLTHLNEDLLIDLWVTTPSLRAASFKARFPGLPWSDALDHVINYKDTILDEKIKLAEIEMGSYFLKKRNRLSTHPELARGSGSGINVVHGLSGRSPAADSRLAEMRSSGKPIFSYESLLRKP